ncbi:hypothetical protein HCU01_34910 [Halomonas cupida]|nr:hypothetical protein HCU01_34910 [Halomonas cupida]
MGDFRGARFRNIVATLEAQHGRVDPDHLETLEAAMRANLNRRLATDLTPIVGATEALAALTDYPMGVVSNGPENKVSTSLNTVGLTEVFGNRIFSGYTANCWKPDPCLYLHAASIMGFAAEDCIAIDDAIVGVHAALAAGMTVIHLNRFPDAEETPEGAIMITSMFQLPTVISSIQRQHQGALRVSHA